MTGAHVAGHSSSTLMAATTSTELISERLRNQNLIRSTQKDPADVVAALGAMQSQDYPAAKWGIGLRSPASHDGAVEQAFNDGRILRTHVLRPTWHFVAAADIRWLLALSGPRVHAANAYYYKQSGLTAKVLARSCAMISRSLEGRESRRARNWRLPCGAPRSRLRA